MFQVANKPLGLFVDVVTGLVAIIRKVCLATCMYRRMRCRSDQLLCNAGGMVWCGTVYMIWCGMVYDVVPLWCDTVHYGVGWYMICCGVVSYGVTCCGMVYDMVWYVLVW